MTTTLHIKNELGNLTLLSEFLEQNMQGKILDETLQMQLQLVLEEVVVNVISYAYPGETDKDIFVEIGWNGGCMEITVIDSGIPFNPLEKEDPDLTLSVEERPIGGLGIYLVKQLMTDVHYIRRDGKNILTMIKDMN
ncbi:ATP-binding protein [Parabacteroides sp. APC149_11_2_Y6]|jgi:hypothetical protein